MASSKIEELKKKRQKEIKNKKSQIGYGIIFIILAFIIYGLFAIYSFKISMFWLIGILFGITLQRSRFCFTAGFRDPILVGSTSLLRAVIIALMIGTIGFGIIQYIDIGNSQSLNMSNIPGQVYPVGVHTAIGAIMFGVGMVIAGGCVSGTLMRIGEGFSLQLAVLVGLLIGTTLGAKHFEFWEKNLISKAPTVYMPQYVGFPIAVFGQLILLAILYYIAYWYDKKNNIMVS